MTEEASKSPAAGRGQVETCPFCGGDELNLADNEYRSRTIARLNNIARGQIVEECARVADEWANNPAMPANKAAIADEIAIAIRALFTTPAQTEE